MPQWVVHAWDGTDEGSKGRRLAVRARHLEGAALLKSQDQFVVGGAMLDEAGEMIGSTMIVQFDSEDELRAWLDREPYILEGVWVDWQVHPFRVATV